MTAEPHPQCERIDLSSSVCRFCLRHPEAVECVFHPTPENRLPNICKVRASHSSQQSERGNCPQNKIWDHCPVSERIRQDEREKVLDGYLEWLQAMADIANDDANRQENYVEKADCAGKCAGFLQAKEKLEKLRSKQGGEQG